MAKAHQACSEDSEQTPGLFSRDSLACTELTDSHAFWKRKVALSKLITLSLHYHMSLSKSLHHFTATIIHHTTQEQAHNGVSELHGLLKPAMLQVFYQWWLHCVCVTLGIIGNLKVWNRGRDGRFPSHANEAMEIDWMEVWTQTSYLFSYLGKQEEMVLDTLVCRCLSFCFPLRLPYRL